MSTELLLKKKKERKGRENKGKERRENRSGGERRAGSKISANEETGKVRGWKGEER